MTPERQNRRGCLLMVLFALAVAAVAAWLAFGMRSEPETNPAATNLAPPGDPTSGS